MELLVERGSLGVTEIAGAIGVHKSTACRLLAELEAHQIVEQPHGRGKYGIGPKLREIARSLGA